jgi:hypothetical protein
MPLEIEVRSSGPGPREPQGWTYRDGHKPSQDGRALHYWCMVVALAWPRDGVAIIIRRAP